MLTNILMIRLIKKFERGAKMTKANRDDGPNLSGPPSTSREDGSSSQIFSLSPFLRAVQNAQERQRLNPTIVMGDPVTDDEA